MKILITGAGHGIGQAAAIELHKRGHHVIATDQTTESLRPLASLGMECNILNVLNEEDWQLAEDAQVDAVICSAGVGESGPYVEIPIERLRHLFNTNVFGTIGVIQAAAKHMIKQQSGRVILIGSTAGLVTLPMLGPYNSTKFALESMTDALRMELKQFNVQVSIIEPAKIKTGFNQKMTGSKYFWMNDRSAYANQVESQKAKDAQFFSEEFPVSVVIEGIVHAVEAKRAKPRYITPRSVTFGIYLVRFLPSRWRDKLLAKIY